MGRAEGVLSVIGFVGAESNHCLYLILFEIAPLVAEQSENFIDTEKAPPTS
jgi:hypothetical protein